jgi:Na+-translocating ferredoxin:NAD+ oxidoreductase RnfA subunit
MNIILSNINWLAVAVGTITYCAFCGIWHRQFAFGKKWEQAMGFHRPENWKETNIYYVVPLISCFVTTVTIAILLKLTNVNSFSDALTLGLLAGVGFATAIVFTTATIPTMKKPLVFGAITGTAQALGITIVTLIIYAIST